MIGYGGFAGFQAMFTIMFLLVVGMIVMNLVKEVGQWNKNNHSPKLTVDVNVVAKRTDVHRKRNGSNGIHHTFTRYYVTFQVESGDRMELELEGHEYGMLVEGDRGKLTFQGTRYLGFERM